MTVEAPTGHRQKSSVPPQVKRLTPSAIERYRRCPRRFRIQDLDRIRIEGPRSASLVQGLAIHDALRDTMRRPPVKRTREHTHDALRSSWRRLRQEGSFTSREHEHAAGTAALVMLDAYGERFNADAQPLAVELGVTVATACGIPVRGRIDRVDPAPEGNGAWVIDYKTGTALPDREDLPDEPWVQTYVLGAQQVTGRLVERVRVLSVSDGRETWWDIEDEDRAQLARALNTTVAQISADDTFDPNPGDHCAWCDVRGHCDLWTAPKHDVEACARGAGGAIPPLRNSAGGLPRRSPPRWGVGARRSGASMPITRSSSSPSCAAAVRRPHL